MGRARQHVVAVKVLAFDMITSVDDAPSSQSRIACALRDDVAVDSKTRTASE